MCRASEVPVAELASKALTDQRVTRANQVHLVLKESVVCQEQKESED